MRLLAGEFIGVRSQEYHRSVAVLPHPLGQVQPGLLAFHNYIEKGKVCFLLLQGLLRIGHIIIRFGYCIAQWFYC